MDRTQKTELVKTLHNTFQHAASVVVVHCVGLTVSESTDLRNKMRKENCFFKVTKNRITKIALKDTKYKELEKFFTGPTAAAICSDPIMSAKVLSKYAKSGKKLKLVSGYMDGKVLEAEDVAKIATLPTLDEARAKIVGILSIPAQKFLSILLVPGSKIAILAHEKSKKN